MKVYQEEPPREFGPLTLATDTDDFAAEYTDQLGNPLEFIDPITDELMTWLDAIAAAYQKYAPEGFENMIVAEEVTSDG